MCALFYGKTSPLWNPQTKEFIPLFLASGSPQRKQLLIQAGLNFECLEPGIDETSRSGETVKSLVTRLSSEKVQSVLSQAIQKKDSFVILGCDTMVFLPPHQIFGKPTTRLEATQMLMALSGKTHKVLTGVCYLFYFKGKNGRKQKKIRRETHTTEVTFLPLEPRWIESYLDLKEYEGKAGAYGAQGSALCLIQKFRGSYTNVVGLPVSQLIQTLQTSCEQYWPRNSQDSD